MSTLYNLEPPPTAKVVLNTTSGDIVLEIFAKQTPLTSRNFLQHCLDGYYDNTIFHRLVPGFIIQGGDPTGLGTGGTSAINNGAPFEDEVHSRLRFNRLLLDVSTYTGAAGKNTMFGRVEGDTIYNLMKMGEADLAEEGGDRPLYPTKVTGAEILVNPFEDMVKRVRVAERTKPEADARKGKKRKAGKNLLSFGAEEGEDEGVVVKKKAKVNPELISAGQEKAEVLNDAPMAKGSETGKKQKAVRKRASLSRSPSPPPAMGAGKAAPAPIVEEARPKPSPSVEPEQVKNTMSALEKTNAQIAALKESMRRNTGGAQKAQEKPKSVLEAMIPASSTKGRKRGRATDERGAMDFFNAFKSKLKDMPASAPAANGSEPNAGSKATTTAAAPVTAGDALDTEEKLCDLHFIANCQSCSTWDKDEAANGEADDDNDADWMAHSLSFAKDTLGKDLEWKKKMEEFEVIDPREKAKDIKESKRKDRDRQGGSGRDWDRRGGNRERERERASGKGRA
ncbi:Peptidyl-prolyl isomerase cwc27 [Taxawa tesnikishii (nom. ined.)]|nr:Peptidyl-prolyl isomerase cwc27 [Dothideales sp. JES 119]